MKKSFIFIFCIALGLRLFAQNGDPSVRLAIVSESSAIVDAADLLTAAFSKSTKVQLLERAEIEKIIREQQLSLNNLDCLKLGNLLGADGVLALQSIHEGTNTFLNAQLVAVKPGVILSDERFLRTAADPVEWSQKIVSHWESLLPKLNVSPQDAIPISVVNFHAGVLTPEAAELERQIFFLTVERLAREKRLFVLERKRMQTLSEEKEMSGSEKEPFWNGKYLLDGAIDRNGFNPDIITISARLIPPGGQPILIEASGSRTNYVEAVNQLAGKVLAALNMQANPEAWNTADEAENYFKEAKWNLDWKLFPLARQAAEAAWALGKHDPECMDLRVRTLMRPPDSGIVYYPPLEKPNPEKIDDAIQAAELYLEFSRNLPPDEPKAGTSWYQLGLENLTITTRVLQQFNWSPENYLPVAEKLKDLRAQARAIAELLSRAPSVRDSYYAGGRKLTYYDAGNLSGIYRLKVVGGCLWQDKPEDEVALYLELMSSPMFCYIHEAFWFRNDEFIQPLPWFQSRLVAWNETDEKRLPQVWQDFVGQLKKSPDVLLQMEARALRLADTVKFTQTLTMAESHEAFQSAYKDYERELTSSFTDFFDAFVSNRLAFRTNDVGVLYSIWGVGDLVSKMGGNLVTDVKDTLQKKYDVEYTKKLAEKDKEIEGDVAVFRNLEAFASQKHFLQNTQSFDVGTFSRLFILEFQNYSREQALEIKPLLEKYKNGLPDSQSRLATPRLREVIAKVDNIIHPTGITRLSTNLEKNVSESRSLDTFAGQKEFLQKTQSFDAGGFSQLYNSGFKNYSREQALEIKPLLEKYKNGLSDPESQMFGPMLRQLIAKVDKIINPPPAPLAKTVDEPPAPEPLVSSDVLVVKQFYPLPLGEMENFKLVGHQMVENRLVMDYEFSSRSAEYFPVGRMQYVSNFQTNYAGMAVFDPTSGRWQTVEPLPVGVDNLIWRGGTEPERTIINNGNGFSHHSTIWRGDLYSSNNGKIQKFDWKRNRWDTDVLPVSGNCQIYNLNGKLYIADHNSIQQISDDGRSTRLLASTQRRPTLTTLDSQSSFFRIELFTDAQTNLCVAVDGKVYRWDGTDWRKLGEVLMSFQPEVSNDGVLFMADNMGRPGRISCFDVRSNTVETCLVRPLPQHPPTSFPFAKTEILPESIWKTPNGLSLPNLCVAYRKSDLFIMTGHSEKQDVLAEARGIGPEGSLKVSNVVTASKILPKEGYDSVLFRFSRGRAAAEKILLRFDNPQACSPMAGLGPDSLPSAGAPGPVRGWMIFTPEFLICGRERIGWGIEGSEPLGFKPGIWVLPVESVMSKFSALEKMQPLEKANK